MATTDHYRKQHLEILSIADEITKKLMSDQIQKDPKALRNLLSTLAGKLTVHLAMEDKYLYPRLIELEDVQSKGLATKFMIEMGDLARAFDTYSKKWQTSVILSDPIGFRKETQTVFSALAKRIDRENAELYPLADAAL